MAKRRKKISHPIGHLPLAIGSTVRGVHFEYAIKRELGKGGRGHAFIVQATRSFSSNVRKPTKPCVLKTVRVDTRRSADEVFSFAGRVHSLLVREFRALRRLGAFTCVPQVYDFGQYGLLLKGRSSTGKGEIVPLTFIVSEFVRGKPLNEYLSDEFGRPDTADKKIFSGIKDPRDWFRLARALATALLQIQQREVVHRDIWDQNILVDGDRIQFIDFGDAYFRQELAAESPNERSDPYVAPEIRLGSRWPSRRADIYSLGGVYFYMAAGCPPPNPPIDDDDVLKTTITEQIHQNNPDLLQANCGIADLEVPRILVPGVMRVGVG